MIEGPDRKKVRDAVDRVLNDNFIEELPVVVFHLLPNYSLRYIQRDLPAKGYPNIAGYIDMNNNAIVVNKNDSIQRQMFTVAHELGHWLMHKDELVNNPDRYAIMYYQPLGEMNNDPIEVEANLFAAHLLVPEQFLKKIDIRSTIEDAKLFGVPPEVLSFRQDARYAI